MFLPMSALYLNESACLMCTLDFFCANKKPEEAFMDVLRNLKEGTTEIMTHPSLFNTEDKNSIYGKIDLDILTNENIKKLIKEESIELITYKEL